MFILGLLAVGVFGAPRPQFQFPSLPQGLTDQVGQGGADIISQGGRLLAGFVRTTSGERVNEAADAGNVSLPPAAQNAVNNADREAAARVIENGANFVQDNAGDVTSFISSLFGNGR